MKRVVQISDTHFSPAKSHFSGNWAPLRKWLLEQRPDWVIHTGDVTVDGADFEEDLAYCASLFAKLGIPMLSVPGNHDVGEPGHAHQPVDAARIERWRRHLGPDWWSIDLESWRLVGLDAMLFGSGLSLEHEQSAWLDTTLRSAEGRSIAWFMHRPLFLNAPDEGDTGYWSVKPLSRAPLLAKLREHQVALVATGHLHQMHEWTHQGCRYVFGPSAGFVVSETRQKKMPGEKLLGAVVYEFEGHSVDVRTVELDTLTRYWIDDVVHEVYPPRHAT